MPAHRPPDPRKDPAIRAQLDDLQRAIGEHRAALQNHPVYGMVQDREALRTFMRAHVFAVWDFMTLLKALQGGLTCTRTPWLPVEDTDSARFINEIVLGEETDEVTPGFYTSHYALYLDAMEEVGADTGPMRAFEAALRAGVPPTEALALPDVPAAVRPFVAHTLEAAAGPTHAVASVFLFGREDVIPAMFLKLLGVHAVARPRASLLARSWAWKAVKGVERALRPQRVETATAAPPDAFRVYLERHIELDGESHGPMGERLLMNLCRNDDARWDEATAAAIAALRSRRALWDAVMADIQAQRAEKARVRERRRAALPPAAR